MKYIYRIFFVVIFFSAAFAAYAEDSHAPSARASVNRHAIFIGDRIKYEIDLAGDKGLEIEFPKFANDKIGDFEIKDSGLRTKKGFFDKKIFASIYEITAYTVGSQTIPPVEIRYRYKNSKDWSVVKTQPIDIVVETSLSGRAAGASDIIDIKGPFHFFEINRVFAASAVFMLISGGAAIFIYRLNKRRVVQALPHETASEELEALKGAYERGGDVKEYYVGISDCIRRYIERAFRLKAPEMTTEEFLNSLKDPTALHLDQKDLLKEFLNACDMVKFAKYAPARAEVEVVFQTAKKFVDTSAGSVSTLRDSRRVEETKGA